jgi:hypothetical protein
MTIAGTAAAAFTWRHRFGCAAVGLLACALPTWAASHRLAGDLGVIQAVADVTLIDRRCRALAVDFGRLFRYGEAHGLMMGEILPLGAKRASFEAALQHRLQVSSDAVLCSAIATQDEAAIPGVLGPR